MADNYADELRKLADTLDEAKRELNLARKQSTKPKHLYISAPGGLRFKLPELWRLRSMKLGSGGNPDGTLRDNTAFAVWIQQICPVMRSRQTTGKADAGAFDIPKVKTDDQGRILGRDGKPLQLVEKTDPETGEPAGSYLQGPEARVTDDYDEADTLEL